MVGPGRLAVWGSPISHSRSPALHAAAIAELGVDWRYGRAEVDEAGFDTAVDELGADWLGLSLTMPLKRVAFARADALDDAATATGSVNTLAWTPDGLLGRNTDVHGTAAALGDRGAAGIGRATVIGAGATASSVVLALIGLGASEIELFVRTEANAAPVARIAEDRGARVRVRPLADLEEAEPGDAVVCTVPGPAQAGLRLPAALAAARVALDVSYDPWPSRFAAATSAAGVPTASGLDMLVHQAHEQVAVFLAAAGLPAMADPGRVLAAMRAASGETAGPRVEG